MKKIILPLLTLVLFCACGKNVLIDDTHSFNNAKWLRFEPESFSVEAPNTDDCFNFIVTLQIDTAAFHEAGLPLMIEVNSPVGDTRTLFSTLLLRNHENHWMGDINSQGILEVSQVVRQFYFFNSVGTHSINISQRTSKYEIHGINSIKFKVEKTKIVYPE